jgi:heptose I phosphotransferase
MTPSDPAGAGLQPAGDGLMWLDGRFHARLRQAGLAAFDAVMDSSGGRCLRVLTDRENWYFRPPAAGTAAAAGLYLKKHHVRTWSTRVRAKLSAGPSATPARIEARHAGSLSALGIDVMPLVAYGERLRTDGTLESFLLTEELAGYEELQAFVRRRFPATSRAASRRDPGLRRIVGSVAEIVRRLHDGGYNHRDLYCCHFLIKEPSPGEFDIRLIDLQRVQRRRWLRRRWIVKDLAQLAYSAPRDRVGCKDQVALLHRYFGVRKLRPRDKRLIGAVMRKVRVMQRRLGAPP